MPRERALPAWVRALDATARRTDIALGDGHVAVRRWGAGPRLVLFHGGHGSWLHWVRNIEALTAEREIVLLDLPGFGESVRTGLMTMPAYMALVARVVERLVPDGPVALGGFSFGAGIAARLVPLVGARLEGLVLVGSPHLGHTFDRVRSRLVRWRGEPDPERRELAHAENLRVLMLSGTAEIDREAVLLQQAMAEASDLRLREQYPGDGVRVLLGALRPRTLAIFGGEDVLVRSYLEEAGPFVAGLGSGSQMQVIPGAGHWVQYEAPDKVSGAILDWLRRDGIAGEVA